MRGIPNICGDVADMLREACNGEGGVTVVLEDSCDPSAAMEKALGGWGVLVLVAASSHRRRPGSGASTAGELAIDLTIVENPRRNRKSGAPGATVTSVAETARDALHWRRTDGYVLDYVEMRRADEAEDDYRMIVSFAAQPASALPRSVTAAELPEPEEIVERRIVAIASAALPGWDVVGMLAPAAEGSMREIPDTCVIVSADTASQNLDWTGPGVPCSYAARVEVRVSPADDRTGRLFRDACRAVRAALSSLLGDRCSALDGEGFACDSFRLGSTETPTDGGGDYAAMVKTYNAAVAGRFIPQTNQEEN